jgi:hypothetical protein
MKISDTILGVAFVLVAILILVEARTFPTMSAQNIGPGTFPSIIAGVMLIGGAALALSGLRRRLPALQLEEWIRSPGAGLRMLAVPGFIVLYILLSKPVGFPLLVPVLLAALLMIMSVRPVIAVPLALGGTAAIWLLFASLLMVPLPLGLLTEVIY